MSQQEDSSIWTIGHSTLTIDDFLELVHANEIKTLADVRSFPSSRRYPHFNRVLLSESLTAEGIEYLHLPELGGRRKARPDSANTAWRNASFRGYANYMQTDAFHLGIKRLLQIAKDNRTAIMCAEAVWWRCHRGLIADYLKVAGMKVIHINSMTSNTDHPYTTAARIQDGQLNYGGLPGLLP
jgi:uncharacterized protein (DUF488 family)